MDYSPSVAHDANPSTAASQKQPVTLSHHAGSTSDLETYDEIDGHEALDDEDDEDEDEDDIPYDVLRPVRRRKSLPPLPDLRFEQSYLASIKDADTNWKVAYITIRDQVCNFTTGETPFLIGAQELICVLYRSSCLSFRERFGHSRCMAGNSGTGVPK
jgi:hypothetical protein